MVLSIVARQQVLPQQVSTGWSAARGTEGCRVGHVSPETNPLAAPTMVRYPDQLAARRLRARVAMRQVNLAEAKSHLSALVQAAMTGTDVVIARDGKPMVRLVPVAANAERTLGLAGRKGFFMADDFDAPLDEFADYMK